jgi:hypothetical protein
MAAVLLVAGCKTEFQKQLNERRDFAQKAVFTELEQILATHRDKMLESVPKDLQEPRGETVAAVQWRVDLVQRDTLEQLQNLLKRLGKQNPEAEKQLQLAIDLYQHQRDFWVKRSNVNRYTLFLNDFLAKNKEGRLAEEAGFDRVYLHLAQLYDREKYDEDTRLTSMFRFWKAAFNFPSERKEPFSDYLNRLCNAKLKDYCAGIMWETRGEAMEKPYLEALRGLAAAYRKDFAQSPFVAVLDRIDGEFLGRLKLVELPAEYPVLTSTASDRYCVGALTLDLGTNGVRFDGNDFAPFKEGYAWTDKEKADFLNKIADSVWEKVQQQNSADPYLPLVTVLPDGNVPASLVFDAVRMLQQNRVDQVAVCGRKRLDGSNRKTMHLLTLFPEKNKKKKEVLLDAAGRVDKITQVEQMDSEKFKGKLPRSVSGKTPTWLGYWGKLPAMDIPAPVQVLLPGDKGWSVVPLDGQGKPGKAAELPALTPDQQRKPAVLLVPAKTTLAELFKALDAVELACKDPECRKSDYLDALTAFGIY